MEQAYLYRAMATVDMDKSRIPEDPTTTSTITRSSTPAQSVASTKTRAKGSKPRKPTPPSPSTTDGGFRRDKVALFCSSMSEIEKLRSGQIERLKQSLHVKDFPEHVNISDPSLLPFLSPKVRAVVEAFPLQAEAIIKRKGLASDEFNQMLEATKSNPFFRWKIQKVMRDTLSNANPAMSSQRSVTKSKKPIVGVPPPKPRKQPQAPGQATAL